LKDSGNIEDFDQLVRGLFEGAESPVPPGVWEGVSSGVSSGASVAGTSIFKSIIAKWVAAVVGGLVLTSAVVYLVSELNSDAVVQDEIATQIVEESLTDPIPVDAGNSSSERISNTASSTPKNDKIENTNQFSSESTVSDDGTNNVSVVSSPNQEGVNPIAQNPEPSTDNEYQNSLKITSERVCVGGEIGVSLLAKNVSSNSIQWWLNNKISAVTGFERTFMFDRPGKQLVEIRFTQDGIKKSISKTVLVESNAIELVTSSSKGEIKLTANNELSHLVWFVNSVKLSSNEKSITYPCEKGSVNRVVLVGKSLNGCSDTVRRDVTCTWEEEIDLEIPNFFSPYVKDGQNDKFVIRMESVEYYQLQIRDSKGRLVFETNDQNVNWNGQFENTGELLPEGWYGYVLIYGNEGDRKNKFGKVLLGL